MMAGSGDEKGVKGPDMMRLLVWALALIGLAVFMLLPVILVILDVRHPWLALFLAACLLVVMCLPYFIYDWVRGLARRRGLMALADKLGLEFADLDFYDLPARYGSSRLFKDRHRSRKASRIISGPVGDGKLVYFDYGLGSVPAAHNMSVCAFHCPYSFKKLYIRPESKGEISPRDIDLDLAEFNDKFYVECADRKFAYEILTQRAMQLLLDRPEICMEMEDDYFLLYYSAQPCRALSVEGVERLILGAKEFADLLPNYLKKPEDPALTKMPRG